MNMSTETAPPNKQVTPDLDLDLSTVQSNCLLVKCLTPENSSHEIKSYFQKEVNGGNGDVDGVIYPLHGDNMQAAVIFGTTESALKVCEFHHEKYTVEPAKMVFTRLEATICSRLFTTLDDITYDLENIGVQIVEKSEDERTVLGNWLQIKETERAITNRLEQPKGATGEDTPEAQGLEGRHLSSVQPAVPAAAAMPLTSLASPIGAMVGIRPAAGAAQDHPVGENAKSSAHHVLNNSITVPRNVYDSMLNGSQGHYPHLLAALKNNDSKITVCIENPSDELMAEAGSELKELLAQQTANNVDKKPTADLHSVCYDGAGHTLTETSSSKHNVPLHTSYWENTPKPTAYQMVTDKKSYRLHGVEILVYQGDLTKLSVDAIVNPANEYLSNGAGAARAIADAGGTEFQDLCNKHVIDNGRLCTGQAVTLPATGRLKERGVKYVINCVGPQWYAYPSSDSCGPELAKTVFHCLQQAEGKGCHAVAMPAISSGVFSVPMDVCTAAYIDGISDFLTQIKPLHLKAIHLVNIDRRTCDSIEKAFTDHFAKSTPGLGSAIQYNSRGSLGPFEHTVGAQSLDYGASSSRSSQQSAPAGFNWSASAAAAGMQPGHDWSPTTSWDQPPAVSNRGDRPAAWASTLELSTSSRDLSYAAVTGPYSMPDAKKCTIDDDNNICPVCLDTLTAVRKLPCGHIFCGQCISKQEQLNMAACPVCRKPFGMLRGNQPPGGTIQPTWHKSSLPGYSNCGHIQITYQIPSGIQGASHPNPGKRFSGTSRTGYLPDNAEGQHVLNLLVKAFEQGLTFTVGTSNTTGQTDCVVWNDIHHKTNKSGGPTNYGYPDPDYLQRVKEELAAKGIR